MGIAEGKFLAYLAALYSPPGGHRVLGRTFRTFLKDLPCDVLPVSLKSKEQAARFRNAHPGAGDAALLPGPLQAQFGPEGKRIWELARGYDDTPLYPRFMEEIIEESTALSSVTVSLEALLVTCGVAAFPGLCQVCSLKGRGIRSLTLWTRSWRVGALGAKHPVQRAGYGYQKRYLPHKAGSGESPSARPGGAGGNEDYRLGPRESDGRKASFPEVRARDHLLDDIKQLELRLGSPQVFKIKEVEPWSRIPERRYALTPLSR